MNNKKNEEYLKNLMNENNSEQNDNKSETKNNYQKEEKDIYTPPLDYSLIDINYLPAGIFYKPGTKISIRAAKVSEIQSYSVVDDNNYVDITEKMNALLSRNIVFVHPDGKKGTYRDVKDADRMFLIFMIRELTFQGGNTLTKEVQCKCGHEFEIPFRATPNQHGPSTFEFHYPNEKIDKFWQKDYKCYRLVHNNVSYDLAAPTIGIQEDLYEDIKSKVQDGKEPDVAFMKIVPFLLHDRNSITSDGIKAKQKEFKNMDDLILFQGMNAIVNNIKLGIKGIKMKCPECGEEVHTELTFPGGASTIFEIPNILDDFIG